MIVSGLRDRLLKDSLRAQIRQALTTLGWFDGDRYHKPVNLIDEPPAWDQPVTANTVAVDFTGSDAVEWEVGSRLTSEIHIGMIEVYAENDSLGIHLSNDIRDWLRGRLQPALPTFPIYDYRQGATPPVIGYMDVDNVSALRDAAASELVWLRHWFRVRCEIRDTYAGSIAPSIPYPSPDLYPAAAVYPGG